MRRGALALWLAAAAAGCGSAVAPATGPAKTKIPPGPGALMTGVHARQVVRGRVEVEIFAGEAWNSRTADWVQGRNVRVNYFPAGRKPATLTASEARYDFQMRRLKATGVVHAESEEAKLDTSELIYDGSKEKVTSDRFVRITRGSTVMTGLGMRADPDLGNMEVDEPHIEAKNPGEIKPLMDRLAPPPGAR